jgi:hypothetical protein
MNRKLKLLAALLASGAVLTGVAAAASSPGIVTGSASSGTTSAVLHGTVNPNGASTSFRFVYGLTRSYGLATSLRSAGSGTKAAAVSRTVGSLIPGTTYHYLLFAVNKYGQASGADRTFKTTGNPPPEAATGPTAQLSSSGALVTGVINPHSQLTTYLFQYGLSSAYTAQTFPATVPAGATAVIVAQQLQGLESDTTFHYRIVALHGSSVVQYGTDATFSTYPNPRLVAGVHQSTSPGRDRSAPYVFTTSGKVSPPASISAALACSQNATGLLRFFLGKREVASNLVAVQPDCTFLYQTVFKHLPGRGPKHRQVHLRVVFHFRGDNYLAPVDTRGQTITLG